MACATSTMASATRTFLITARLSAPAPEAVAGAVTVSGAIACAGTVARGVSASCRLAISAPPSRASGPRTFTRCRLLASVVEPGARSSPHDAAPRRYVPPTGTAAADGNLNASSCVHRQDRKSMPHPPARDDRAKTQKTRMRLVPSATSLLLGAVEAATEPDAGSRSSRAVHCRFEHAGQFFRSPPVPRMEATGDFWKGPFCRLEAEALECVLADAKQVKNLPGRPKRDPSDSRWLAACFERGAVTPCFVATPEFRVIRLHTRYRRDLTGERTRDKQRAEKLLESAAIKISSVITDLHGVTGRDIMDHLIAGQRPPQDRRAGGGTGGRG